MKNVFIYCLMILCGFACKKDNQDEINYTMLDATLGTLKCRIDGQQFYPSTTLWGNVSPINVFYYPKASRDFPAGYLSIQGIDARYSMEIAGNIVMNKTGVFGTGEYALKHTNCEMPYSCDGSWYYNTRQNKNYFAESGKLTITKLDTTNKIIVGRFFINVSDTLGNKKTISEGVFNTLYEE